MIECNGQTISAEDYPELVNILGTNIVPNLNGRVLQGSNTPNTFIEAGLPNITGGVFPAHSSGVCWFNVVGESGAFYAYDWVSNNGRVHLSSCFEGNHGLGIDASRCSAIYGNSTTVQPPAYTVKYYICYQS